MTRKTPRLQVVSTASTDSKVEKLLQAGGEQAALEHVEFFSCIQRVCESPIEELLLVALYNASKIDENDIIFMTDSPLRDALHDQVVYVHQQTSIDKYRVDIAIHDCSLPFDIAPPRIMIVECDGHDFHERTKEQARRDKQRDRFLVSKGFKLLRFTGSEIWADPEACADEIINELACNDAWRNRSK